jgi:hypothetical protein
MQCYVCYAMSCHCLHVRINIHVRRLISLRKTVREYADILTAPKKTMPTESFSLAMILLFITTYKLGIYKNTLVNIHNTTSGTLFEHSPVPLLMN